LRYELGASANPSVALGDANNGEFCDACRTEILTLVTPTFAPAMITNASTDAPGKKNSSGHLPALV
jgi:hypothetical protein